MTDPYLIAFIASALGLATSLLSIGLLVYVVRLRSRVAELTMRVRRIRQSRDDIVKAGRLNELLKSGDPSTDRARESLWPDVVAYANRQAV